MIDRAVYDRVVRILFEVVDELNKQLPKQERLERSLDTALSGSSGRLDSLGLINFIIMAEQKLGAEFGTQISLTGEAATSEGQEAFATLKTLSDHLVRMLEARQHA